MNRRRFLKTGLAAAGGLLWPIPVLPQEKEASGKKPPAPSQRTLQVVELKGRPRERGRIHGETLKDRIAELVVIWKDELRRSNGTDPDAYIAGFLADTDFYEAVKRWTPDLLEEVKGIAEGSGIDLPTLMAYQCVDEEWWYGRNKRLGIGIHRGDKCSVLAAFGQQGLPPLLGQNLDLSAYPDGFQTLLHVIDPETGLASYVLTYPGLVGMNGLNSNAVAVCVNALLQLDQREDGLPVAFVVRGILSQESHAKALRFVQEIKHASGQCYTIGGPEGIAAFECSASKAVPFEPAPGATRLCHTNHPFVNDDQGTYKEVLKNMPEWYGNAVSANTRARYAALEKRLEDPNVPVTVEAMKAALGSHDDPRSPVCNHPRPDGSGGLTFACTVMELSRAPVLHVAPGPPCETAFHKFRF